MPSSGSTRLPACGSRRCWCVKSCCGWARAPVSCSPCPPHPVPSAARGCLSALPAWARDTLATCASWLRSSCQMGSTCSARRHRLPQTQVGWHILPHPRGPGLPVEDSPLPCREMFLRGRGNVEQSWEQRVIQKIVLGNPKVTSLGQRMCRKCRGRQRTVN